MGTKRTTTEADQTSGRSMREVSKRRKISPSAREPTNSSEPSSCSVSEDSALQSSPPVSRHTRESSVSSIQPLSIDDESESEVSSTTDESSASESEEEIITIGGPKKPDITRTNVVSGAEDLRTRLSSFLPQMAQANEALSRRRGNHSMEDVDEDDQHIEMNLGLGVLEAKNSDDDNSSSDSSSDAEDEQNHEEDVPTSSGRVKRPPEDRKANVIGRMMRQRSSRSKVGIEDVG